MEEEISGSYTCDLGNLRSNEIKPKVIICNFGPGDTLYKDGATGRFISRERAKELGLESALNP